MLAFICGGVDDGYRTWAYCERILTDESPVRESIVSESNTSDEESATNAGGRGSNNAILRAAAADGWALLATLRTPEEVLERCVGVEGTSLLEPLLELLKYHDGGASAAAGGTSTVDVKVVAGKCMALMWEVADKVAPSGSDASESGRLLCDNSKVVDEVLDCKFFLFYAICIYLRNSHQNSILFVYILSFISSGEGSV
jgi:hypothetical protein